MIQTLFYLSGVDGQTCSRVIYTDRSICASKGSSVDISCLFNSPESITSKFWFSPERSHQWQSPSQITVHQSDTEAELKCHSSCSPAGRLSYVWFKNRREVTGEETSSFKDAPRLPSVSVSPSAEIVEGSSVTLTCSSDANPAANYTWYKEKQKLIQGPEGVYHFSSISSEDRGNYYCKSENQYGEINSSSLFIDLPSVSVSPSAEIVEGSSVTLTCSSDANPAANYTWYKENEDSPKASGQIFTITDFRAEHSGNYSCKAQNSRGRQNSTLQLLVVAGELLIPQHDPFLFSLVNPLRKPTPLSHVQLFLSNLQSRLDPIILVTSINGSKYKPPPKSHK
uniref:Ig-like domain-containing protein n=1 Tax=Sparus aurata TaxID=8175 RepID=A0A671WUH5_SPAAU